MSPKQQVYQEMLWWTLPHLRNVSTGSWWRRGKDKSAYFESELIHNLPVSMYEPEFTEHDIWFLNVQAQSYCKNCSASISPLYPSQVARIERLLALVPSHLVPKLQWPSYKLPKGEPISHSERP